ncbi:MAG TPA: transporter [Firmicutes bacterium]|jgi:ABC-2 type transport system permease protein|nr:transporter [Bacillota bacterium]
MRAIKAILIRNLTNFTRDKMRVIFTLFMSIIFLFVFSFVMKSATKGIAKPMNYLISGIIIMTVFQAAMSNAMSIIEDISSGFMKEILVAPIDRWQISIGQIFSSMILAVLQGVIIIVMGIFMGLNLDLFHFMEMIGIMIVVGITFSSMGLYLATLAKSSTSFQIMTSLAMVPLTFLSGAYIPTTVMPSFLRPVIYLNPLTYTTAVFRFVSLKMERLSEATLVKTGVAFKIHGFIVLPYFALLMVLVMGFVFFTLCVHQFNRADFSKVKVFKGGHH